MQRKFEKEKKEEENYPVYGMLQNSSLLLILWENIDFMSNFFNFKSFFLSIKGYFRRVWDFMQRLKWAGEVAG